MFSFCTQTRANLPSLNLTKHNRGVKAEARPQTNWHLWVEIKVGLHVGDSLQNVFCWMTSLFVDCMVLHSCKYLENGRLYMCIILTFTILHFCAFTICWLYTFTLLQRNCSLWLSQFTIFQGVWPGGWRAGRSNPQHIPKSTPRDCKI